MSSVITVRVPRRIAEKIEEMVEAGPYRSKSSLVREYLRRYVADESGGPTELGNRDTIAALSSALISWDEKAVTDIMLFGSTSRGEATPESDIDLLILVKGAKPWVARRRLYNLIYPLIAVLGVDISLIVVDREDFLKKIIDRAPFAVSILKEGKQLYGDILNEYRERPSGKGC